MTEQKTKPQKPPYTADNRLRGFIHKRKAELEMQGKPTRIRDIMNDVAAYCDLSYHTIDGYCTKIILPSLPSAMKVAEYFNVKVEDIFFLTYE